MKIITALVTPFTKNNKINYPVIDQLVHDQIEQGADGIVIGGTTGEFPTLSAAEVKKLYEYTSKKFKDIPLYCGVGCPSTQKTVERIKLFERLPFQGYLIVVPYYNLPPQAGLIEHFKLVSQQTKKQIIAYNVPKRTGSTLEIATIKELAKIPNITLLKDATLDIERLLKIKGIKNISLFLGDDQLFLWGIKEGIPGIVSVLSNGEMGLMKKCVNNSSCHDQYANCLKQISPYVNPVGIKKYLREKGYAVGTVRLPLVEKIICKSMANFWLLLYNNN